MGGPTDQPRGRPLQASPADRLDSWKEIAVYLKRDARTVQRWERHEALPVHRHSHKQRGTVYAYRAELDAWWAARRSTLEKAEVKQRRRVRALAATATGLILLTTGLAIWRFGWSTSPRLPTQRQVAILDFAFMKASPDGRWLAYQDSETHRIWLRDLENGRTHLLVDQGWEMVGEFTWSPESTRLAFTSRPTPSTFAVEWIDIRTKKRLELWSGERGRPQPMDWSKNGEQLLCLRSLPGEKRELVQLALRDGNIRSVMEIPVRSNWPQLSPDGRSVVYASVRDNNWDLFLAPTDGSAREIRLTDHPAPDMYPLWAPDGKRVLFQSERTGTNQIWILPLDSSTGKPTGEPASLSVLPGDTAPFSVDASGTIYFRRYARPVHVVLMDVNNRSSLQRPEPAVTLEAGTSTVGWSPDGKLFYRKPSHGQGETLLAEKEFPRGQERLISFPPSHSPFFMASPVGGDSFTFYGTDADGQLGIYRLDHTTRKYTTLWRSKERQNPPMSWSSDGRYFLFSSAPDKDGRFAIRVLAREGGQPVTVTYSRARPFPQWSPDGKQIAYTDEKCLRVIPRQGGTPRTVVCSDRWEPPRFGYYVPVGTLAWFPDGRRLAWTVPNSDAKRQDIWIVDVAAGERIIWAGAKDYASWHSELAWSPDGRRLAANLTSRPKYEVWILSNLL